MAQSVVVVNSKVVGLAPDMFFCAKNNAKRIRWNFPEILKSNPGVVFILLQVKHWIGPPTKAARWYIFTPKNQIWEIFRALEWKLFRIFYDTFVYFTAIWYILRPLGIHKLLSLVAYSRFWYVSPRAIWQPCLGHCWNKFRLYFDPICDAPIYV
jgi:hypothetical protein